jgi:hypothetical protein
MGSAALLVHRMGERMKKTFPMCKDCGLVEFDPRNPSKMGMCTKLNKAVVVTHKTACKFHPEIKGAQP